MRAYTGLVLLVAVLGGGCEGEDFVTGGGGDGDSSSGGTPDAGEISYDGGGPVGISGRVCRVDDVRSPAVCDAPIVATVRIGAAGTPVTSGADGRFTLPAGTGGATVVLIATPTTAGLVVGASPVRLDAGGNAGDLELRVVRDTRLTDLLVANLQAEQIGRGQVVVSVVDALGQPVSNGILSPIAGDDPYYASGGDDLVFATDGTTGPQGFAMYFNLAPDDDAPFLVDTGTPKQYATPIVADAVTFTTVTF